MQVWYLYSRVKLRIAGGQSEELTQLSSHLTPIRGWMSLLNWLNLLTWRGKNASFAGLTVWTHPVQGLTGWKLVQGMEEEALAGAWAEREGNG